MHHWYFWVWLPNGFTTFGPNFTNRKWKLQLHPGFVFRRNHFCEFPLKHAFNQVFCSEVVNWKQCRHTWRHSECDGRHSASKDKLRSLNRGWELKVRPKQRLRLTNRPKGSTRKHPFPLTHFHISKRIGNFRQYCAKGLRFQTTLITTSVYLRIELPTGIYLSIEATAFHNEIK